ncbi:MAG: STAS domain-containing protein [Bacteroidaceae bacterium]|nr:STAS domain-containing protein [Bacteroidaceae bacterium]
MEIKIQDNTDSLTVTMIGSFDTLAAEQVEPTIKEIESLASKPMIIDCNALDYVASSGLRVFLRLRKASAAQGQQITLLGINENIMEVFKVTHFDRMFIMK